MDTKALRQKILDLAIRGKLVPQNPSDEPASVLLERIRAQKQQMVKEGKLKPKDIKNDTIIFKGADNLHYEKFQDGTVKCIEDEIPFEIPQGWEWTRISSVSIINPRNVLDDSLEVSFVPMANIEDGYANKFTSDKRVWSKVKTGFTHFAENDLAIAKITPCFENRKSVIFKNLLNGYGAGTTELHIIRMLPDTIMPDLILYYFKREEFIAGGIQTFSGDVGQQRVTRDYIARYLIAIPSKNDQKRIVEKIEQAFDLISKADLAQADLVETINKVKSRILDLAIRGKLVPQDPNDEPASVLLERIREEKEELIKQGKIKPDKKESVIFKGEDNSYYQDLPKNWTLTTLADITTPLTLNDGDWILSENMDDNGNVKLIQLGAIGKMQYIDKGFKFISDKTFNDLKCSQVNSGFLLINRIISDAMNVCILPTIEGKIITTVDTCWIAPNENNYSLKYLMFMLSSSIVQSKIKFMSSGTTRKRISKNNLIKIPFPFPPLAEQHRIVYAIETYFSTLDKISNCLS